MYEIPKKEIEVILNPEHENLYKIIKEQQKKKCDELNCNANDGQGHCRINTCSLIDPEKAIEELKIVNGGEIL